jgi:hypothetical protein
MEEIMKRLFASGILILALAVAAFAQGGPGFFYVATTVDVNGFESAFSNQVSITFTQGHHITLLTWQAAVPGCTTATPPICTAVAGYNILRGTVAGGPYTKINTTLVTALTYSDTFVLPNAPSISAAQQ